MKKSGSLHKALPFFKVIFFPIEHATEDIFPLKPVLARTRAGTNILAHRQDGMQQIHPHVTAGDGGHVVPRQRNGHIERATEYRRIDGRFRQEDKLGKRVDEPVLSIVGRRRREDATQRRRQKGTSAGNAGESPPRWRTRTRRVPWAWTTCSPLYHRRSWSSCPSSN